MKKLLLALFALCAFAACDNGGDDTPKNITITGGGTNQTIYADETSVNKGEGIRFTTTGAWRAEVEEVTRSVSWITLSQTGGDKAGDYTLQITLGKNATGADRKATIKIICDDTVITITVEQKGTTEGGDIPDPEEPDVPTNKSLIAKIVIKEKNANETEYTLESETNFTYDAEKRLIKVVELFDLDTKDVDRETTTYDYTTNTMVNIFHEGTFANGIWQYEDTETTIFRLNSEGYVTEANGVCVSKKNGAISHQSEYTNQFTYTTEGYLASLYFHQIDKKPDGSVIGEDGPSNSVFIWTGGNLTAQKERDSQEIFSEWEYGTLLNNSNLDLNWMLGGDYVDCSVTFTKMGKRSKNRMTKFLYSAHNEIAPEPGTVSLPKRTKATGNTYATLRYETDTQGRVTKVYTTIDSESSSYLQEISYK